MKFRSTIGGATGEWVDIGPTMDDLFEWVKTLLPSREITEVVVESSDDAPSEYKVRACNDSGDVMVCGFTDTMPETVDDTVRYVVLILSNADMSPAYLCASLAEAKARCRAELDPDDQDPPLTAEERVMMERQLAQYDGAETAEILGSQTWKCRAIVAPAESV